MKRIVVLIDGTWNKEGTAGNTNVAKLDIGRRIAANAFIKAKAADGTAQHVHYHDGVGTEGDFFMKIPRRSHRSRAQANYKGMLRFRSRRFCRRR